MYGMHISPHAKGRLTRARTRSSATHDAACPCITPSVGIAGKNLVQHVRDLGSLKYAGVGEIKCSTTDICGTVDPQARTHPVEVNSKPWSSETCVRGVSPPSIRKMVTCIISDDKRGLIDHLLVERLSLRGICRAVGVTRKWLLGFLVQGFEALPDHLHVQPIPGHGNVMLQRLEVEADDMASFVQKKAH